MKRYNLLIIMLCVTGLRAIQAQEDGLTEMLHAVDSNNTTLQALRGATDAIQMGNRTGLNPENPQFGFNHLKIAPTNRTRTDFSLTQTIDFPTAYAHRRRIARSGNAKAELEYDSQRAALRYETAQTYINWVYTQHVAAQYVQRLATAKQLADAYQRTFEAGEVSILELNKAKVNLVNAEKAAQLNAVEREALKAELIRLNGGNHLPIANVEYPDTEIPVDFDTWYAQTSGVNPVIQALEQDIAIGHDQQRLSRALSLPALTAGYMYEEDTDVQFRGVTVGLSIPLWQQRNTVKQAKLQTQAAELAKADADNQFYNAQRRRYQRAHELRHVFTELQTITEDSQGQQLIKRALDLGELSLLEYLVELTMYYETVDRLMETERDLHLTLVELHQWTR